jgi:hypothetical protein
LLTLLLHRNSDHFSPSLQLVPNQDTPFTRKFADPSYDDEGAMFKTEVAKPTVQAIGKRVRQVFKTLQTGSR